jgi:RecA-family ATPase
VKRGLREGAGKPREPHSDDKLREEPEAEANEEQSEDTFQMSAVREHEPGEVNWIVEDVIPEGFTLLAGRPKMGKSFLILDIAVNVANGKQVAKAFPTEQTGVLYLALEDNKNRIVRRLDAMGIARQDYPANCTVATSWPAGQAGLKKLDKFLNENPSVKLIEIDTLQHILKPDTEEGYRVTSAELRPLQRLALEHHAAIVAVLHTRKSKAIKDDEFDPLDFDNILGSRAYSAVADAIIMMHRARNEKFGRLAITGRDVSDAIYEASFDKQRWEFAAVNRRATIRKQVIELFEQHCEAEYSPLEVCQRLGLDTAKHHDAMRQRLSRMEKEGAIERVSHGKYKQRDILKVT